MSGTNVDAILTPVSMCELVCESAYVSMRVSERELFVYRKMSQQVTNVDAILKSVTVCVYGFVRVREL